MNQNQRVIHPPKTDGWNLDKDPNGKGKTSTQTINFVWVTCQFLVGCNILRTLYTSDFVVVFHLFGIPNPKLSQNHVFFWGYKIQGSFLRHKISENRHFKRYHWDVCQTFGH